MIMIYSTFCTITKNYSSQYMYIVLLCLTIHRKMGNLWQNHPINSVENGSNGRWGAISGKWLRVKFPWLRIRVNTTINTRDCMIHYNFILFSIWYRSCMSSCCRNTHSLPNLWWWFCRWLGLSWRSRRRLSAVPPCAVVAATHSPA